MNITGKKQKAAQKPSESEIKSRAKTQHSTGTHDKGAHVGHEVSAEMGN